MEDINTLQTVMPVNELVERAPIDASYDADYHSSICEVGEAFQSTVIQFLNEFECPAEQTRLDSLKAITESTEFTEDDRTEAQISLRKYKFGAHKYLNMLQAISNGVLDHLEFNFDDYLHYASEMHETGLDGEDWHQKHSQALDLLLLHASRAERLFITTANALRLEKCQPESDAYPLHPSLVRAAKSEVVPYLQAPFQLTILPPKFMPIEGVRSLSDKSFGALMQFDVIVAKVYAAQPRMMIATYLCPRCDAMAYQPIEGDEYMPLRFCESEACKALKNKGGELQLVPRYSRMIATEIVLAQEKSSQVPQGQVPRRKRLVVEGCLTKHLEPGMSCTVTGIIEPSYGRSFGESSGKVKDTVVRVKSISVHKRSDDLSAQEKVSMQRQIKLLVDSSDYYSLLARSIAPSVFGLDDVKKALLLQMIGAPTLHTKHGFRVRGEIHILMMGDPGVAKSQLLGKVTKLAPRSSYTSGKSASGVGLTASVFKDPQSGEFSLEGGSVVIADTGICGIDEFDKLDEGDRTAIHEVMEQQTVSISKAGLNVQLNARTAILAAANPAYGRYDPSKSIMHNISLPYSLISRFDLQFLMLDMVDERDDMKLALHILKVHKNDAPATAVMTDGPEVVNFIDAPTLRYFIARAQEVIPTLPDDVAKLVQEKYVDARAQERLMRNLTGEEDTYTTPRTLFSIIRLSQALARVRFSGTVSSEDVEEACRLMDASKESVKKSRSTSQAQSRGRSSIHLRDAVSEVLDMIRKMSRSKSVHADFDGFIPVSEIEQKALTSGFSKNEVNMAIHNYVDVHVLQFRSEGAGDAVALSDVLERTQN